MKKWFVTSPLMLAVVVILLGTTIHFGYAKDTINPPRRLSSKGMD